MEVFNIANNVYFTLLINIIVLIVVLLVSAMFVGELHITQRCICKRVEVCTYDRRHHYSSRR